MLEGGVHDKIVHVFRDRIFFSRGPQRARRRAAVHRRRGSDDARLEATIPLSIAEVHADKDLLRAPFAMSTRCLETNVKQLKTKSASQLAELGRKGDADNGSRSSSARCAIN